MEIVRIEDGLEKAVKKAAAVLAKGGIILYPTDTLYGLGVDATNPEAVERLRELKGRERKKPIGVVVPDVRSMERCGTLNFAARDLAERFLPGPLTLVLPANPLMPSDVMLNGGIGVRVPKHEFCLALARAFGKPFTTTSANLAGMGTPSTVNDLIWHFGPKVSEISLIVDGGVLASENPSTVVSCVTETPQVIRVGAISREELGL